MDIILQHQNVLLRIEFKYKLDHKKFRLDIKEKNWYYLLLLNILSRTVFMPLKPKNIASAHIIMAIIKTTLSIGVLSLVWDI